MCKSKVTEKVPSVFTISMNVNNVKTIDQLPKCETITLTTEWGTLIKFQIDNGAAVNIIPISANVIWCYKHGFLIGVLLNAEFNRYFNLETPFDFNNTNINL